MSQIHVPVQNAPREARLPSSSRWVDALLIVAVVVAAYGIVRAAAHWTASLTPNTAVDLSVRNLPRYAGLSTLRMAIAYLLSLAFSLAYARAAIIGRMSERVMVPLLDVLQSIPILSFLPGVVLGLVALFPRNNVGLELAAVLLVFTSQAWNMAFSFHQSLLTIPQDLREAASVYRLTWWGRFTRLELPFGMIPLIWNSMMSWAGGWFFLMAAEQFMLGTHNFQLEGLGSYLQKAANDGNVGALLLGLATLIVVIVLLDQLLWRPVIAWSDRFKIESTSGGEPPVSGVLRALNRSQILALGRVHLLNPAGEFLDRLSLRSASHVEMASSAASPPQGPAMARAVRGAARPLRLFGILTGLLLLALALWQGTGALKLLTQLSSGDWITIVESLGATLVRTTAALLIGVAWTVPVGVAIGTNPRLARRAQPLVQMVASIPATALFPALLLVLLALPGGLNLAAVGLMLLGTQWYLLFNVMAGAMAIPSDLKEAAAIYHLHGWQRWRTLILPAIFPYLVTGGLTASGGAWNASVVSEYVTFSNHTYSTIGIGALIAKSANDGNFALVLAATLAMAALVVSINRLVWRRLYHLAEQRYHLD